MARLLQHCDQWWQQQTAAAQDVGIARAIQAEPDRGPPPVEDVAMWCDIFGVDDDGKSNGNSPSQG